MKRKTVALFAALAAFGLLAVAAHFALAARSTRAKATALMVKATMLEAEARRLRMPTSSPRRLASVSAPNKTHPLRPGPDDFDRRLSHDPRFEALWIATQRPMHAKAYAALFRKLQLSADDEVRFLNISDERSAQMADIRATAIGEGLGASDPALRPLYQQANAQYRAALEDLLGDGGYQEVQAYNRTLNARNMVSGFAGTVAAGEPLSAAQGDQLIQAIANASLSYNRGGAVIPTNVNFAQVDATAQQVLTPSQFAAWQQTDTWMGSYAGPYSSRFLAAVAGAVQAASQAAASGH